MPFTFRKLDIPDLILIEPRIFDDERGFFAETYKSSDFKKNGISVDFLQDNHSLSQKGVLRGLHFQEAPRAQGKLVRVVKGRVWDVAVDVRRNSPTFMKWISVELSEENNFMFYIPEGFAHGFVSLTDNVHLTYKCSDEYSPEHDSGIRWDDPDLAISWPVDNPLVSVKDAELPYLKDARLFE
jgi:dTDP-4-dehydrorhamnose 3,5-epimerase